jgi:uncharacterized protein YecT (DUF1311 family)
MNSNTACRSTILLISVVLVRAVAAQDIAAGEIPKIRTNDRAAVASCLGLAAAAEQRRTAAANKADAESDGAAKAGTIDPAAYLAQAGSRAQADPASCIGVVSEPCQQTPAGGSNLGSAECMRRELAVWNERLNAAYKKWTTGCDERAVCEARRKLGRAWLAKRDARCALPAIEAKGSMAIPMTSYCLLEETARQAIWLEERLH